MWDIADDEVWALGLIGIAPAHVPRPAYYAYQLYADHYGPDLGGCFVGARRRHRVRQPQRRGRRHGDHLRELEQPRTSASRCRSRTSPRRRRRRRFRLPAESLGAIEIPDNGNARAWTYAEAERKAAVGPQPLVAGTAPAVARRRRRRRGAGKVVGTNCPKTDGGFVCPRMPVTNAAITVAGMNTTVGVNFGAGTNVGVVQLRGARSNRAGRHAPPATATACTSRARFVPPIKGGSNYMGFGLYYSSDQCLDAARTQACSSSSPARWAAATWRSASNFSGDSFSGDDPARGGCQGSDSTCYGPSADVTAQTAGGADAGVVVKVPFTKLSGGVPDQRAGPQHDRSPSSGSSAPRASPPTAAAARADFTVKNVAFYK